MQTEFPTERLMLKILHPKDAPLVADYYTRNYVYLKAWQPRAFREMCSVRICAQDLHTEYQRFREGSFLRFYLFLKADPQRVIGTVSFFHITRGSFDSCMAGYSMDEKLQGQGYITEALAFCLTFMFQVYRMHRIELNIMPRNRKSLRVAEKLGFVKEGLARELFEIDGVWEDHIRLARLREDS